MKNLLIVVSLLLVGSCAWYSNTLSRPTEPSTVQERASEFLPLAINIVDRAVVYSAGTELETNLVEDATKVRDALADPEALILVDKLRPLLWIIPVHNQYVVGDETKSANWRESRILAADALRKALQTYLLVPDPQ